MFRPADRAPHRAPRRALIAPAVLLPLALLAPFALAGITSSGEPLDPTRLGLLGAPAAAGTVVAADPSDARTARRAPPAGTYQVRCWQQGRLLFEENQVALPADATRYGLRMSGTDRHGRPLYVADTQNATCLIRSVDDERAWPR